MPRLFQYSLKTIFVLILLATAYFGGMAVQRLETERALRQAQAAAGKGVVSEQRAIEAMEAERASASRQRLHVPTLSPTTVSRRSPASKGRKEATAQRAKGCRRDRGRLGHRVALGSFWPRRSIAFGKMAILRDLTKHAE